MGFSRRNTLCALVFGSLALPGQIPAPDQAPQDDHDPNFHKSSDDPRLPNGKSQRDEIARQQHADALKDVDSLLAAAEELRDELKRAGNFTVPVGSVRKTEEIEKLAKRIRGRLKN